MTQMRRMRAGLGVPTLTLIVMMLCLTLLGTLALADARADRSLGARQEALAADYYQAAAQAQRALAALDAQMAQAFMQAANEAEYARRCMEIAQADGAEIHWSDASHAVFYLDAGSERRLCVEIERSVWEKASARRFCITRHALEDTTDWGTEARVTLIA